MTAPKVNSPRKERPFKCVVRGCKLDLRAHGRMAAYLEETEGPESANWFDSKHRDRNAQDD
jgi:hypothetical protein